MKIYLMSLENMKIWKHTIIILVRKTKLKNKKKNKNMYGILNRMIWM